jgi:tight adherence protein C
MVTTVGILVVVTLIGVAGVAALISGLSQPTPSLARMLLHLGRPSADAPRPADRRAQRRPATRALAGLTRTLQEHPRLLPSDAELRLIGRPVEEHVALLAAALLVGLALPSAFLGGLQAAGVIGLSRYVPMLVAIVAAAVGPLLLHASAVAGATRQRVDMRHQLSAYLDVVSMLLAGNTGYEGALEQAASAGDGRLFLELRRSMREAAARGASLTDALQRTGAEMAIEELEQVAATASLSAAEGAPVARTLAAKCATLRATLATEQETEARLRTSRLTTPVVGMALIFMALVIYPALSFS